MEDARLAGFLVAYLGGERNSILLVPVIGREFGIIWTIVLHIEAIFIHDKTQKIYWGETEKSSFNFAERLPLAGFGPADFLRENLQQSTKQILKYQAEMLSYTKLVSSLDFKLIDLPGLFPSKAGFQTPCVSEVCT